MSSMITDMLNECILKKIESLAIKTIILEDAGAYKNLKTRVEDLYWFDRHHNIQAIYLAYPVVRENCLMLYITI